MINCSKNFFWDFLKKFFTAPKCRSILLGRGVAVTIRETIQEKLERRGWSRYRLIKELEGAIPANTVYDYLRGETDIGSDRASIILEALGLTITRKSTGKTGR